MDRLTTEEYLAMERAAAYKSEYVDGEIIAMVGASEPHNLIVTNMRTDDCVCVMQETVSEVQAER
jgi:Uma2 family endonuclease